MIGQTLSACVPRGGSHGGDPGERPASAGTCATRQVPRRGEVTVCVRDGGCDLYIDPGGRTVASCVVVPDHTSPVAVCTDPDLPGTVEACLHAGECTVFVSTGRPPGLCL